MTELVVIAYFLFSFGCFWLLPHYVYKTGESEAKAPNENQTGEEK